MNANERLEEWKDLMKLTVTSNNYYYYFGNYGMYILLDEPRTEYFSEVPLQLKENKAISLQTVSEGWHCFEIMTPIVISISEIIHSFS